MIRKLALVASALGIALLAVFDGYTAMGSGTQLQTVTQTETIVSSHCYKTHRVTTTYYRWSKTTGWTAYPSPKRTVTDSETCR